MATKVYATSNAAGVGQFFIDRADGVRLFGAAASASLAKTVRDVVLPLVIEEAPELSGDLKASIGARTTIVAGGADVSIGATAAHTPYVLDGTGIYHVPDPHDEWDVYGYQAFEVAGSMVYTTHTHHLGQKPNDFPGRAWERAKPAIEVAIAFLDNKLMAVFL